MLKRCLAILLLLALVSSNFTRLFVIAGFEANQDYIAAKLCENKARPWMHCNGKCYLVKKLEQTQQKEKKQEQEQKRNQYQEALPAVVRTAIILKTPVLKKSYPLLQVPGTISRAIAIFQPPQAA
jgi:hypothetical protein